MLTKNLLRRFSEHSSPTYQSLFEYLQQEENINADAFTANSLNLRGENINLNGKDLSSTRKYRICLERTQFQTTQLRRTKLKNTKINRSTISETIGLTSLRLSKARWTKLFCDEETSEVYEEARKIKKLNKRRERRIQRVEDELADLKERQNGNRALEQIQREFASELQQFRDTWRKLKNDGNTLSQKTIKNEVKRILLTAIGEDAVIQGDADITQIANVVSQYVQELRIANIHRIESASIRNLTVNQIHSLGITDHDSLCARIVEHLEPILVNQLAIQTQSMNLGIG